MVGTCMISAIPATRKLRKLLSKSRFKLTVGPAQVVTTGEPVFVKSFSEDNYANVVRPVPTSNGIEYRPARFPVEELETVFSAAKRKQELDDYLFELHQEAENKRYALPPEKARQLKLAFPQA